MPADIPAGEYVVGWRWDAEMTSQVSGHAALAWTGNSPFCRGECVLVGERFSLARVEQHHLHDALHALLPPSQVWSNCADITIE